MPIHTRAWALREPGRPLECEDRVLEDPAPGFALLEVIGCGVCHTDLGFADGPVRPKAPLPLVLGHEIVGRVCMLGGDPSGWPAGVLAGVRVLAPAVSPCGDCPTCRRGRPTACPTGRMPGNDADGGFATHVVVPVRDLCALDSGGVGTSWTLGAAKLDAWELAPIADAGTTAWQAIIRARLRASDVAVFVGAGGVGGFGLQLARSEGAHTIAVDVDRGRLDSVAALGAAAVDATGLDARATRDAVRSMCRERGWRGATVRIFECSGTPAGQLAAFEMIERGGSLSIVGYTPEKISVRLSNVMALDAEVHGNWGCDPSLYGAVIQKVLDGTVQVRPFVERRPLAEVGEVLGAMRRHELKKRVVLTPEERPWPSTS